MNKVAVIGTGMVGSTYAYSLVNQNLVDEVVLINRTKQLATAQAKDIIHGTNFLTKQPKIYAGDYTDLADAKVVCITSGAVQKPGETRLELLDRNVKIMSNIVTQIKETSFNGILLIAANPVDIMTDIAQKASGFAHNRVIGSGTVLDTARLRQNLAEYLNFNVTQIHANVIGEHGDSSIAIWSTARVGNKKLFDLVGYDPKKIEKLNECFLDSQQAAYQIIEAKGSTYFGIGLALAKITKAILYDENVILSVTNYIKDCYGVKDVYISVPAIVNKTGIREIYEVEISQEEQLALKRSVDILKELQQNVVIESD